MECIYSHFDEFSKIELNNAKAIITSIVKLQDAKIQTRFTEFTYKGIIDVDDVYFEYARRKIDEIYEIIDCADNWPTMLSDLMNHSEGKEFSEAVCEGLSFINKDGSYIVIRNSEKSGDGIL